MTHTSNDKKFYLTTPIYYPSGNLTIGNSYTTVIADALARYHRMRGEDVMFLTGTDEHGQKLQRAAAAQGQAPKEYIDQIVAGIKDLWQLLNISYDRFIRTTDDYHVAAVQEIFQRLYDQGDIYKSEYVGHYCTPCESFWTDSQLDEDGLCPDCHRPLEDTKEECYFLRLSKYADRLIQYYEDHPDFIQPDSRANEMINNFLKPGLEDLAVSRTSFDWGIKVPFDEKHVIYVWLDALTNYITALGYPNLDGDFARYWPADLHLVGKDIIRFHTIIWPVILMALDLPLPEQVFGHGWLLMKGGKLSKSKLASPEEVSVVDPVILCELYGVDAVRYFLLREISFGQDGNFSNQALINRINSDLANDLGNLLSRTVSMILKYFPEGLPAEADRQTGDFDQELLDLADLTFKRVEEDLANLMSSTALQHIWELVVRSNKYIDETTPWVLAKDEDRRPRLAQVLYNLADCLSRISVMIAPFMPESSRKMDLALGIQRDYQEDSSGLDWQAAGHAHRYDYRNKPVKTEPLFPRIDPEESLAKLRELAEAKVDPKTPSEEPAAKQDDQAFPTLDFADFEKMELRVAKVLDCEKVPKADRLLKFNLDLGSEQRTVVSGLAEYYQPEELLGKKVILLANLAPRKLKGVESQGMILSVELADGSLKLVDLDQALPAGSLLC